MSNDLVEREKIISQGTIDCALFSLEHNHDCNLSLIFFDKSDYCELEIYFLFLKILKLLL